MKRLLLIASIGLVALGCHHDPAPDATPAASVVTAVAPASAAPDAPASAAALDTAAPAAPVAPDVVAKIPAEEDFEPQAATAITAANASQQLAAIEKEIAK